VPQFGMYGAALATLLSYGFQFALVLTYTQRLVPVVYNYGFVCRYGLLALAVAGIVLAVSYLSIPVVGKVILKLLIFSFYLLVILKTSGVKESFTEMFRKVPAQ
jgi:O-antigen/teichoic acid export membrane protein